jgi:hypothetical protein
MNPLKKGIAAGAVVASALTGGAVGAALVNSSAGAADNDTQSSAAAPDPSQGGHQANGITEELLTGDTAAKVTAAAEEAVPDGTIQRVETDAEGSPYEAHVTKSDGTQVTVKVDSDFNVTAVEDGPSGPPGQAPATDGNA